MQPLAGPQVLLPLLHRLGVRLGQLNTEQWEKGLSPFTPSSHLGTRHELASLAASALDRWGPWE